MTRDVKVAVEAGLVRATYRGAAEYGAVSDMLRKVGRIAAEMQSKLLLFDLREVDFKDYHADTIRHAEDAPALGIDRSFRIALLGSGGNPMLRYLENVAVNRGFQVKAFTDESEAVAWLRTAL
jgi:hypothetical protein